MVGNSIKQDFGFFVIWVLYWKERIHSQGSKVSAILKNHNTKIDCRRKYWKFYRVHVYLFVLIGTMEDYVSCIGKNNS